MKVVSINFDHPSYNWANGLYIVIKINEEEGVYDLCRLNEGKPELFSDGRFMISCTGLTNPSVKKTNLVYLNGKLLNIRELRKVKLEKLNHA